MNDRVALHDLLCQQWCSAAEIVDDDGALRLSLPLVESDGDVVTVWLERALGGWKIRDHGTTLMRLSYDMDIDLLDSGQRAIVVQRVLEEQDCALVNGELVASSDEPDLGRTLLSFGQAMVRLSDVQLWTRTRVASTFYDDLQRELERIAGADRVHRDYLVPGLANAESYPVDFSIDTGGRPFYVWGVPNTDKARIATIILLHLQKNERRFDSLIVPLDIESIHKADLRRLTNAANDMITGINEIEPLERKVRLRLAT